MKRTFDTVAAQFDEIKTLGYAERIYNTLTLEFSVVDISDNERYELSRQIRQILLGRRHFMDNLKKYLAHYISSTSLGWALFGLHYKKEQLIVIDYAKEFETLNKDYKYFDSYEQIKDKFELAYKFAIYCGMVMRECSKENVAVEIVAYKMCVLFGKANNLLKAIDDFNLGQVNAYDNPIMFLYHIELPVYRDEGGKVTFNLEKWCAFLPSMRMTLLSHLKCAPELEKALGGALPESRFDLEVALAKRQYKRYEENPSLAQVFIRNNKGEDSFNETLEIMQYDEMKASCEDVFPDVKIDVSTINPALANHYLVKLPKRDVRTWLLDAFDKEKLKYPILDSMRFKTNAFYVIVKHSGPLESEKVAWETFVQDGNQIVGALYVGYTKQSNLLIDKFIAPCIKNIEHKLELIFRFGESFLERATYIVPDRLVCNQFDKRLQDYFDPTAWTERLDNGLISEIGAQFELSINGELEELREKVYEKISQNRESEFYKLFVKEGEVLASERHLYTNMITSTSMAAKLLTWDENTAKYYMEKYGRLKNLNHEFSDALNDERLEDAKYLYELGADIKLSLTETGIGAAASNGNLELVKFFLDIGACYKGVNGIMLEKLGCNLTNIGNGLRIALIAYGDMPLKKAVENEHFDVALYLIDAGYDMKDYIPQLIEYAIMIGWISLVERLMKCGPFDTAFIKDISLFAAEHGRLGILQRFRGSDSTHDFVISQEAAKHNHHHICMYLSSVKNDAFTSKEKLYQTMSVTDAIVNDFFGISFLCTAALRGISKLALVNKAMCALKVTKTMFNLPQDITLLILMKVFSLPYLALIKVLKLLNTPILQPVDFGIELSAEAVKDLTYRYYFQETTKVDALSIAQSF